MKEYLTTGEIAKLCGVSIRTVQYYDKEGIVKPSCRSENGRRLYSQEDVERFQLVCLYKSIGLSLHEMKHLMKSDHQYEMLVEYLEEKKLHIDQQIKELSDLNQTISVLLDDISMRKSLSITNIQELKHLINQKRNHQKYKKLIYLLLIFYVVIVILSGIVILKTEGMIPVVIVGINIIMLLMLIYLHSQHNAYVCPCCHQKFTVSFIKDMLTIHDHKKGYYLKCPYCHHHSWMKETYIDLDEM